MPSIPLFLILCLPLLTLSSTLPNITYIQTIPSNSLYRVNITSKTNRTFLYKFPIKPPKPSRLSFLLSPLSLDSPNPLLLDLDIQAKAPNRHSIALCQDFQNHSCSLETQDLNDTKLYLVFQCRSLPCEFKIHIMDNKEIRLAPFESHIFSFRSSKSEIFNISIPEPTSFDRLILTVSYPNHQDLSSYTLIPDLTLQSPSFLEYQEATKLIIVIRNSITLPITRDLSLQLVSKKLNVYFEIHYTIMNTITELALENLFYDSIDERHFLGYKVQLPNITNELSFLLKNHFGSKKSLMLVTETQLNQFIQDPTATETFLTHENPVYYAIIENEASSIIKGKDLLLDSQNKLFFIVAPGTGCFSIELSIKNQRILPLKMGRFERHKIQNKEIQNFEFQSSSSEEVTLDFVMESGNADLYMKPCDGSCVLITPENLESEQFSHSLEEQKHKPLSFQPQCNSLIITGLCKYQVVILGNSSSSLSSKYHLLVKQRGNHMVDLPENTPVRLLLENRTEIYCRFWLPQDPTLLQVSFSISSISASFFVSTSLDCLKKSKCDDKIKGDSYHPITENLKKNNDSIIYYLKLVSLKTSYCLIDVTVDRVGTPSIINLYEGVPHRGYLDGDHHSQLYIFHIDLKKKTKIFLNLNSDSEKMIMYASDKHVITKEHTFMENFNDAFHWKSHKGCITIKPSHKHYTKSMTYYILVTHRENLKLNEDKDLTDLESVQYYIMFSTEKTLKSLENNVPFYGKIESKETTYFQILINPLNEEFVLTKFLMRSSMNSVIEQKDLLLVISPTPFETLNLSNIVNLTNFFSDPVKGIVYNSFRFSNLTLSQLCRTPIEDNQRTCPLYISLTNNGDNELLFGLTINIKGLTSELFEGVEVAMSLKEFEGINKKRFFFMIKDKNKGIEVYSEADLGTKYDLDVMFIDHRKKNLDIFDYESVEDSNFSSIGKSIHSISVSGEDVNNYCQIHCLLIITLSVNNLNITTYPQNELLYLIATSDMTVLNEGHHLIFSLQAKQYKYFSYPLNDFLQNFNKNDSLTISLSSLTGSANFFVSESNRSEINLPTVNKAMFYSYQNHLSLKKEYLISQYDEDLNPELIIGVTSDLGGKFILDVLQNNIITFYPELPLNLLILSGENRIYEFSNYYFYSGFQLKFFLDYGQGNLLIFKQESNQLLDELLDSNSLINITLENRMSYSATLDFDSNSFCFGCGYYIVLRAKTELGGTLSLNEKGGIKYLLMNNLFFDSLDSNEYSKYQAYISLDRSCKVFLTIYSGSATLLGYLSSPYSYFSDQGDPNIYNLEVESDSNGSLVQRLIVPESQIASFFERDTEGYNEKYKESLLKSYELILNLKVSTPSWTSSNYSLEIYQSEEIQILREGTVVYAQTNGSQKTVFLYERHKPIKGGELTGKSLKNPHLTIQGLDPSKSLEIDVRVSFIAKSFENAPNKATPEKLNLTLLSATSHSLECLVPADKEGVFTFELINKNKITPLSYYIIISSHKLSILPYDVSLSVSMSKKGVKYYETYVPKKGILALEILECYGSIKVSRTSSYNNLMNKKGILEEFDVLKDLDYINYYKVKKPGHYFFLIESIGDQFTNIQISMKIYDSLKEIPQKKLKLPDNGNIDYQLKGKQVSLNFSPIVCPHCNGDVLNNTKVTYELIIGNSLFDVDSIGKCRMGYPKFYQKKYKEGLVDANVTVIQLNFNKNLEKENNGKKIVFEFAHNFENYEKKLMEKGFSHFFTIRAIINGYPLTSNKTIKRILPSFDLYYETLELNFKEEFNKKIDKDIDEVIKGNEELEIQNLNYKKMLIIAVVVIVVLLVCVIVACYLDRRRKIRTGLMHFVLDESKDGRNPGRLGDRSEIMEMELETKNLSTMKNEHPQDNF